MIHHKVGSLRTFHDLQYCDLPDTTYSIVYSLCGCTTSIWCHYYFVVVYFMVNGGRFSHPVSKIMKLLSILVYVRPTSTATRLVLLPLFFLFCNSSLGKSGHFQYFWSIFIFHLLGASAHNFCIQDVSTSYFHWFSHPLFLYHPRCYCRLNEKILYHWVSCPLGYQYETVSQMGEWYILLGYLDWGQGYILFSWRSYHIQRFLL